MASGVLDTLNSIESVINSATGALDSLNQKALKGGIGFDEIAKSINNVNKDVKNLSNSVSGLAGSFALGLDLGLINDSMSGITEIFSGIIEGGVEVASIFNSVGMAMDSITGYSRELNSSLFETVSKFNGSFEAAKEYSDFITSKSREFATAEYGFITPADRIATMKALGDAGVPLDKLKDSIDSSAGSMDLLNTTFLHAKSLGMDVTSYVSLLSDAMLKQGLNSQQAVEQMAMFGDVSKNTGLSVDKVSRTLQSLANNHAQLGLTVNFGTPILEGFTNSLKSMGLGFENAIDLSGTLSNSLLSLTSNYATAYLTFKRGGLDMGGGGALGAGIGLRAELLDAQKNGTQDDVAMKMVGALKDTLESFTGGRIITVQEAAEDPKLQQTFYTQTELLKSLYGVQDPAAQDRTLELLSQIGEATKAGDKNLAKSLGEDLQNTLQSRDESLGYAEKTAVYTSATFAELQYLNKNIIGSVRLTGDSMTEFVKTLQDDAMSNEAILTKIADLNSKPIAPPDMGKWRGKAEDAASSAYARADELMSTDVASMMSDALASVIENGTMKMESASIEGAIKILADQVGRLVTHLSDAGHDPFQGGPK